MSNSPGTEVPSPPRRRWLKILALIAAVVVCALGVGAWFSYRHFGPDWSENALGEGFAADHPWTGNTIRPFLLQGENTDVLLGLAARPDVPLAPTYVVLIKNPASASAERGSHSVGAAIESDFTMKSNVGMSYLLGKNLSAMSVVYEGRREPSTESLSIDGVVYTLESGRVFLVDWTVLPRKITQVDADVREILPDQNWQRRQREGAKKAIDRLRDRPAVRVFFDKG
jgi:hypothetical protein